MSDFDKEAEREKLREKYGDEEEKRQATEQMSELLLKGATMTNAHCTDCGDPIFRYDGQEFCPTCQKPVAREQAEDDGTEEAGDDHIEVADPSDDASVQFGDREANGDAAADQPAETGAPAGGDVTDRTQQETTQSADAPGATDTAQQVPSADPDRSPAADTSDDHDAPVQRQPTADSGTADSRERSSGGDVGSDLAAAESLLAETVHRFAQRAAESEDPRTAREHLSAAREAAEALDAVRF